ncbi:MAG: ABC transporter permease [Planctomycetes bacterium]|nr:ABC transporter permease [Planctomycetota bacterium]
MRIPLAYNLRHLRARPAAAAMTALGIALPTTTLLLALALPEGLNRVLQGTGDPDNLVVLRKGSTTETNSAVDRDPARLIATLPEVVKDPEERPLLAPETIVIVFAPRRNGLQGNLLVRGTGEGGRALRSYVRLVEGRWFTPGLPELTVSRRIAERYQNLGLGERIHFGKHDWTVVGLFDAQGKAPDSEAWADVDLLMSDFLRTTYSSVLVRTPSPDVQARLQERLDQDKRLSLVGFPEPEYYRRQTQGPGLPLLFIGMFVSVLLGVGAAVGATNTMYAAVAQRTREIAVLRSIGFRRRSVLASFLIESLGVALLGGMLGCLLALPFHGAVTSTVNWKTFGDLAFQFRLTPALLAKGLGFAAAVGLFGGFLPARLAASRSIAASMRAI